MPATTTEILFPEQIRTQLQNLHACLVDANKLAEANNMFLFPMPPKAYGDTDTPSCSGFLETVCARLSELDTLASSIRNQLFFQASGLQLPEAPPTNPGHTPRGSDATEFFRSMDKLGEDIGAALSGGSR